MLPTLACEHLFVISGCSGSGKSTLIAALAAQGEAVVVEPGRQVVREQLDRGGDALPWADPQRFLELCAERAIAGHDRHAPGHRRTFFDRSLIDVATAFERSALVAPEALTTALRSKRYASLVFMSQPWEAIFRNDEERRHSFSDAVREYEALVPAYRQRGHEIVFIPQLGVAERVAFVLSTVAARSVAATERCIP